MADFNQIIERRTFIKGTFAFGATAFISCTSAKTGKGLFGKSESIDFNTIAANSSDTITLPEGFSWHRVASWGDPLWSGVSEFNPENRGTGESQEKSFGDNTDGMDFFQIDGRAILAVNTEYSNLNIIHGNRASEKPENEDDIRKNMAAHGISVFEIQKNSGGKWRIVKDSPFNRKITPETPMEFTGPAAGSNLLKTADDPTGKKPLGTWNNCGNGRTPWGTYLSCEENFQNYFSSPDNSETELSEENRRYGIRTKDYGYGWAKKAERFDVSKHPKEPHRVGYIVEVDLSNPESTPRKHTAMGRFRHENVEVAIAKNGRLVAYMGDDERGEYLYKFISKGTYSKNSSSNKDLLTEGDLFVAKFYETGRGEWVNLKESGMSLDEISVFTRIAADKVDATTMDRPEWVAVNPYKAEAYCSLTNNKNRGMKDDQPLNPPNPRVDNKYGQIVRWIPDNNDHFSQEFEWDLFVMAGNPTVYKDDKAGSKNINPENMFNSPDGLSFDTLGNLWIQTDGKYSNQGDFAGMGNNQMLMANPETREIKRFMVGPKECEVTGLTWSDDKKTMFVGIQHPGEDNPNQCHFPDAGNSVPRSTVIAITRDDGGVIG